MVRYCGVAWAHAGESIFASKTVMSDLLSATYFPFITMAPSVAKALSGCFDRVFVYQPVGAVPPRGLQPWIEKGFVDVRVPFAGITDATVISSEFANWKAWGSMHGDGDLAYFAQMGENVSPVAPLSPKLASAIKGKATKGAPENKERDLTAQLFLLLTQDFDQESLDIQEQLAAVEKKKQAMEDFFRIDSVEEKATPVFQDIISRTKEDLGGFMTQSRMVAWNHLFQKALPPSDILLTDSSAALGFLLEGAAETVAIGHFSISWPLQTSEKLSLKGHVHSLLQALLTKPFDEQSKRGFEKACNQIQTVKTEEQGPSTEVGQETATFFWYVVPNVTSGELVDQLCKKGHISQKEPGKNTVVGLLKIHSPGHGD